MTITIPWPLKALSPNQRLHWSTLARAKKSYRHACAWQAVAQGARRIDADRLHVSLQFVPPDKRRRDLDNLISSMKSGLDGLADVFAVDDSRWTLSASLTSGEIGGFVRVKVVPC